jgi:hypothetical protein
MEITYEDMINYIVSTAVYKNTKIGKKFDYSHSYNIASVNFIFAFFPKIDSGKVLRDVKREFNKRNKKK